MHSTHELDLGLRLDYAEGLVDPSRRLETGEISQEVIDELEAKIINDSLTLQVDKDSIPCHCMDCRRSSNGQAINGVKAAGGSFTGVIADALTTNSFRHPGEKVSAHATRVLSLLKNRQLRVGGHTADHVLRPDFSGCGAVDKLDNPEPSGDNPSILNFLIRNSDSIFNDLRSLSETVGLGLVIGPELEESSSQKAIALCAEGYATTGKELSDSIRRVAGDENMDELTGPQKAVLAVVMLSPGEILDQATINSQYGDDYSVFEVSAWAIINEVKALSVDQEDYNNKLVVALAYQLASTGVIGGPGLKIIFKQ